MSSCFPSGAKSRITMGNVAAVDVIVRYVFVLLLLNRKHRVASLAVEKQRHAAKLTVIYIFLQAVKSWVAAFRSKASTAGKRKTKR
jgi:hypothetical protein